MKDLQIDLTEVYLDWIAGKSLRFLAGRLQQETGQKITHTSLFSWLNQAFGAGATDLTAMSLQRSLLEDYEGKKEYPMIREWVKENLGLRSDVKHRSNHSIRELTKWQTCPDDEILEYLLPQEDPEIFDDEE